MAITSKSIALTIIFLLYLVSCVSSQRETKFLNHGFLESNLLKFGSSKIHPSGLLELTNTSMRQTGQAFHGFPIPFIKSNSSNSVSFSTSFVFAITPGPGAPGHGFAFVISPSMDFHGALPSNYLGLFNTSNNGNSINRILAVEFDTVQAVELNDIDDNHVGIDLNGVVSIESAPAAYFDDKEAKNVSLRLASGDPIRVWIEYNATEMTLNVTLAPLERPKPNLPLLSRKMNLSGILSEEHFIGFSAATGTVTSTHFVLGWSFSIEGRAEEIDITKLPSLPESPPPLSPSPSPNPPVPDKKNSNNTKLIIIVAASATVAVMIVILLGFWVFRIKPRHIFTGGARKFSYQTISSATSGFSRFLGEGNSGRFFRGQLAPEETIAVKRITCSTWQQRRSLISQIFTISRIAHTNLTNLLGYGRQGNDIYLVYEYVSNGSLDRFLFSNDRPVLNWSERFNIIKGVARALEYLHGECRRTIIHGNVKSSNVLLDNELHARLGDYGQGNMQQSNTGHVAAELVEQTVDTDVSAFGELTIEIVCGRRAIEPTRPPQEISLVNWVLQGFRNGNQLECCDVRINREELVEREVLLVLKLGLLCTNRSPKVRPVMRRVVEYLDGTEPLPNDDTIFNGV